MRQIVGRATLLGIGPDMFRDTLPLGVISNHQFDDMVESVDVSYHIEQALLNGGMDSKLAGDHLIREATRAWAQLVFLDRAHERMDVSQTN